MVDLICGTTVDWEATGSMLSGLAGWGAIAALVWATYKGRQTVQDFTHQRQTEKAMDAAERILAAAYNGRSAINGVRANLMEGAEFAQANKVLTDSGRDLTSMTEDKRRRLETAQAFYNRLNLVRSELDAIWDVMPVALAYFGEGVHQALQTIAHQRRIIQVSADSYAEDDGQDPEFSRSIRADLWRGHGKSAETDPVSTKVEAAIRAIEEQLLPLLRSDKWNNSSYIVV